MTIGYSLFDTPTNNLAPTLNNGKFNATFNNRATFTHGPSETCAPGEYRQYVKGEFRVDGTLLDHYLCPASRTLMSPDVYREDGCPDGTCTAYGHRSCPQDPIDRYSPDRPTGCEFSMSDSPGFNSPRPGSTYRIDLKFEAKLINTTTNLELARKEWTVIGEALVPTAAPSPATTLTDARDILMGAHVRRNLETDAPELHVVFAREPGKTLLDPGALRVRAWTGDDRPVPMPNPPEVHQVESRGRATLTFVYRLDRDARPASIQIMRPDADDALPIIVQDC